MKESLLLSESESVRQNILDANKECYAERSLTDQSKKKFINTTPNSLSKIKKTETVLKYTDILVVAETKIDKTFL